MADVEHDKLEGYRERNRLSLGIRTLPSPRGTLMPMRIPGTGGLGLIELGKRSIRKAYLEDDMPMYAAALGFREVNAVIRNASGGDKSALPDKTRTMRQDANGIESIS